MGGGGWGGEGLQNIERHFLGENIIFFFILDFGLSSIANLYRKPANYPSQTNNSSLVQIGLIKNIHLKRPFQ